MSWLKVRSDLRDNPKLFDLMDILKWPKHKAAWYLIEFWIWARTHVEDGDLLPYKNKDIHFTKDITAASRKRFVSAMTLAGFLQQSDQKVIRKCRWKITHWYEYVRDYLYAKYHTADPEKYNSIVEKWVTLYGVKYEPIKVIPKAIPKDIPKVIPKVPLGLVRLGLEKANGKKSSTVIPPVIKNQSQEETSSNAFAASPPISTANDQTEGIPHFVDPGGDRFIAFVGGCKRVMRDSLKNPKFDLNGDDVRLLDGVYDKGSDFKAMATLAFWCHPRERWSPIAAEHGYHLEKLFEKFTETAKSDNWYERISSSSEVVHLARQLENRHILESKKAEAVQ